MSAVVTVDLQGVFSWECTDHKDIRHGAKTFVKSLAQFNARIHDLDIHRIASPELPARIKAAL